MEIIIFQLLSCLYLYDAGIPLPVCIRKQIRYTGFWPVAFRTVPPVYRLLACGVENHAAGIPTSGVQMVNTPGVVYLDFTAVWFYGSQIYKVSIRGSQGLLESGLSQDIWL